MRWGRPPPGAAAPSPRRHGRTTCRRQRGDMVARARGDIFPVPGARPATPLNMPPPRPSGSSCAGRRSGRGLIYEERSEEEKAQEKRLSRRRSDPGEEEASGEGIDTTGNKRAGLGFLFLFSQRCTLNWTDLPF